MLPPFFSLPRGEWGVLCVSGESSVTKRGVMRRGRESISRRIRSHTWRAFSSRNDSRPLGWACRVVTFEHEEDDEDAHEDLPDSLELAVQKPLAVAQAAVDTMNDTVFQSTVDLLVRDIRDVMDSKGIDVRDRRKELELLSNRDTVAQFAPATDLGRPAR